MSSVPPPLPHFSKDNYSEWESDLVSAAIYSFSQRLDGTGLAGWILSKELFATMPNADHPWEACEDPKRCPNAESTAQRSMFIAERQAMTVIRQLIINSLPKGILALAPDFNHSGPLGANTIAIPKLLSWLRQQYGDNTVSTLQHVLNALHEPWNGESIEDLIGRHLHAHAMAASDRYHQTLPESQKIDLFLRIILPRDTTGTIAKTIQDWYTRYPSITTQQFGSNDGIAEAVRKSLAAIDAANSHVRDDATNQLLTLSSAALVSTKDPLNEILERLRRLETSTKQPTPTSRPRNSTPPKSSRSRNAYCWTHGLGSHCSSQCNHPADGHFSNATTANRRGGSQKGF